jgi:hypothetical protein
MTTAFVLGNGVSRACVNLSQLQNYGKIYGCNAVYREFTPDVLVSTDRPIATRIQESGYSAEHVFYTRRPMPGLGAQTVPKPYFGYSSGPIATALAAIHGNHLIYMLGFDMGPSGSKTINNLYAGTEFYKPITAPPTFTGNWLKQLVQVVTDHKNTHFVRVTGPTTARIAELEALRNLEHLDLNMFLDRINNKKDL